MLQTNTVIHYTFVVQLYRLQFTVKTIKVKQKQKENNKYKTHNQLKKGGIVQTYRKGWARHPMEVLMAYGSNIHLSLNCLSSPFLRCTTFSKSYFSSNIL